MRNTRPHSTMMATVALASPGISCRPISSTIASLCKKLALPTYILDPSPPSPRIGSLRQTDTPRYGPRPFSSSNSNGGGSRSNNNDQSKDSASSNISNSLQNPPNAIQVPPPPTWSIHDLRLAPAGDDEKISEEELATLARRCLIDVRRLSPERRDRLRTHVAGIMRCASVLLESEIARAGDLTDEEIYDAPRGLLKVPVRRDSEDGGDWRLNDSGESKAVMQSEAVSSKMVKSEDGDEKFFSVVTKR
mmetsp:Transcript_45226/g.96219  ORF Transcript_45226/g.96219 Transcript_45226/m.96219 type:complete len:248 (+) Transcript_45226:20-763(+)